MRPLFCLFCTVLLLSCEKDEVPTPPDTTRMPPDTTRMPGGPTTANPERRAEAVRDYIENFARATANSEWTGSVSGCRAGDISAASRAAALQRLNYFRRQVGYSAELSIASNHSMAQASALIMKANNSLNHRPPSDWTCWTQGGATASAGNLAWTSQDRPDAAVWSIAGFMEDPGQGNEGVGHRAWFILPTINQVTIGATSNTSTVWWTRADSDPAGTPEFVSWPPKGYVIDDLVYERWSLHVNDHRTTANSASVRMVDNSTGNELALNIVHRRVQERLIPYTTVVWEPQSVRKPGTGEADLAYTITVSNISVNGEDKSYTYEVILVDAESARRAANVRLSSTSPEDMTVR